MIPNTAAAETRVVQMNCHLAGYLKFSLLEDGFNQDGITDMLNQLCDANLTSTISQLKWDAVHKVVIFPSEAKLEYDLDLMEKEPWMQQTQPIPSFQLNGRKHYNDPDHAFPLSSDLSVTTIHANKSNPNSPPGHTKEDYPSLSPAKEVVIVDAPSHDNISTLSSMSKGDLVKMLLNLNHSNRQLSGPPGFAPVRETPPYAGHPTTRAPATKVSDAGYDGCPVAAAMSE